jgi:hypothetical protein
MSELIKDYKSLIGIEIAFDGSQKSLEETNAAVRETYDFLKNSTIID